VTKDLNLLGKVSIVTGSTNGIGYIMAQTLAKLGSTVVLASRSEQKLIESQKSIVKYCKGFEIDAKVLYCELDLSDPRSIEKFAAWFNEQDDLVDNFSILINNAGIMALKERKEVLCGNTEAQMGTNHLGHFYLTHLLVKKVLERPKKDHDFRVVCLSSMAHKRSQQAFIDDPKLEEKTYDPWIAYGNSKLANILFARELNHRYHDKGISSFSVHPGGIFTGLQDNVDFKTMIQWRILAPFFFKTPEVGASTAVFCATHIGLNEKEGGKYFEDNNVSPDFSQEEKTKFSEERCKKVWETSCELMGVQW